MKITQIGVTISAKKDLGFGKYMEYLRTLNGRQPAFGTRDHSTVEFTFYSQAAVSEEEDVNDASQKLVSFVHEQVIGTMRDYYHQRLEAEEDGRQDDTLTISSPEVQYVDEI